MKKSRRRFSSEFKSKVALEALKERYSLSQLAERFELHPNQISQWKQEFLEKSKDVFDKKTSKNDDKEVDLDKLYAKIGKLEMERDHTEAMRTFEHWAQYLVLQTYRRKAGEPENDGADGSTYPCRTYCRCAYNAVHA